MFTKKYFKKAFQPPGTLEYIGVEKVKPVKVTILNYQENSYTEKMVTDVKECFPFKDTKSMTWINMDGVHETSLVEKLGNHFGLHPLALEDIVSTDQRPKFEDHGQYLFINLKMIYLEAKTKKIQVEQISLCLGPSWVLSFQEDEGDIFDPIRERIKNTRWRTRNLGVDYLAYAIIDAIVDYYFLIMENLEERMDHLEEEIQKDHTSKTLSGLHTFKKEAIFLRKSVWPLREVISKLQRSESPLILDQTKIFLRDVYDHTIRVVETIESLLDVLSSLMDLYLSMINNRLNEIMKVLTFIATLFIPPTFIAGVYGMNFKYMPELNWSFGYFFSLSLMGIMILGLLVFFKRKRWI